ncbi:hypothetical protein IL54_3430 [Sphingobium sp. ba1]|uniref:hypothetical protein n=1 Tax=Sphingobium sp. ba1 TaxID=1522072 RepID=UPI00050511CC|nr:hypothetical protein [Sphingobium sp. ba1]KFL48003.1 hypothetical protein IL54_3430 [Sphingobium sp. ba1]
MNQCEILIDANQVLHFTRLDQIDWCGLTGCRHCTLVITPILLRELEQKKIFSPSSALKARAGAMIDFLVEKMELPDPVVVRSHVVLVFAEHEPGIDFASHHLVREVNDDHYIAAAIERHCISGMPTFIASNDGGMAMKLRSRPISVLRLPDTLRLPAEVDAEQKELRDAKREIARLKSRQPKLAVTFKDGETRRNIRNARCLDLAVPGLAKIRAKHSYLPVPPKPGETAGVQIGGLRAFYNQGGGSRERVEEYNEAITAYYARYDQYLADMNFWTEALRLTASVSITLSNDGSATATDIDVTLRFPKSIFLSSMRDRPEEPEAPKPPASPGNFGKLSAYFAQASPRYLDFARPDFDFHDGTVFVDEDDPHTAQFSVKSLKQKCELSFDTFLLTRHSGLTDKGVEVEVVITSHEGEPIRQKLAMTFEEVDAAASDD